MTKPVSEDLDEDETSALEDKFVQPADGVVFELPEPLPLEES